MPKMFSVWCLHNYTASKDDRSRVIVFTWLVFIVTESVNWDGANILADILFCPGYWTINCFIYVQVQERFNRIRCRWGLIADWFSLSRGMLWLRFLGLWIIHKQCYEDELIPVLCNGSLYLPVSDGGPLTDELEGILKIAIVALRYGFNPAFAWSDLGTRRKTLVRVAFVMYVESV
jgi:hypothetical protein